MGNGELITQIDEMLDSGDIPAKAANRLILQLLKELYKNQGESFKQLNAAALKVERLKIIMTYVLIVGGGIVGVLGWLVALHVHV